MSKNVFLTAEWRRLIMANYTISPDVLKPFLPAHTELDFFDGKCYVSLVGFLFRDVRIKGIAIPWHRHFPEVNLRFYVKHFDGQQWKRGVVFISEIVPKPAISWVANTLYKEHYSTLPMRYVWKEEAGELYTQYHWKKNNAWQKLEVVTPPEAVPLIAGSEEEFITEHFWGYAKAGANRTNEYQVGHPRWNIYPVKSYTVACDFSALYGNAFSVLQQQKPASVFLAEGSAIAIYNKQIIGTQ
ncbi:MAG: DUF2071 domain-containing protein [Bacteroidetes bacterium]|nr:DUF2071 domain-containing protein [Bacteroidota bacterium]